MGIKNLGVGVEATNSHCIVGHFVGVPWGLQGNRLGSIIGNLTVMKKREGSYNNQEHGSWPTKFTPAVPK